MQGDPSGVQQEGIEDQSQRMVADADADTDAILNRIPAPAVVIQQGDPYLPARAICRRCAASSCGHQNSASNNCSRIYADNCRYGFPWLARAQAI